MCSRLSSDLACRARPFTPSKYTKYIFGCKTNDPTNNLSMRREAVFDRRVSDTTIVNCQLSIVNCAMWWGEDVHFRHLLPGGTL